LRPAISKYWLNAFFAAVTVSGSFTFVPFSSPAPYPLLDFDIVSSLIKKDWLFSC